MEQVFLKYIYEFFKKLLEIYDFQIKLELNEKKSYMIEYGSKDFVIKIEKYFREFYASLYKKDKPDDEIDQDAAHSPKHKGQYSRPSRRIKKV